MAVADWNAFSGTPVGVREWPRPGGIVNQYAKTVHLSQFLQREWLRLPKMVARSTRSKA
jgi:hypothetical protein